MSINALRLHADADAAFLAARRVDPVAARPFEAGDLVVVCAACATPMLAETWVVLGGAHCGQTTTSDCLPVVTDGPARAAVQPAGSRRAASAGTPGVAAPDGRGALKPAAVLVTALVVATLAFLVWRAAERSAGAADEGGQLAADYLGGASLPAAPPQVAAPAPTTAEAPVQAAPTALTGYDNVATVDSPGDGFLALRSEPTVRSGRRLVQMPHGAQVGLLGVCDYPDTVDGKEGRWCLAEYGGQQGWAFTAYLIIPPTGL